MIKLLFGAALVASIVYFYEVWIVVLAWLYAITL